MSSGKSDPSVAATGANLQLRLRAFRRAPCQIGEDEVEGRLPAHGVEATGRLTGQAAVPQAQERAVAVWREGHLHGRGAGWQVVLAFGQVLVGLPAPGED